MNSFIENLISREVLKTPRIIDAFKKVDRINFVRGEDKERAYSDIPLPIGFGATISQPYTVAFMLEKLLPERGERILDVGSGSGWVTALLAEIVGESGKIHAVEIVDELVDWGRQNVLEKGYKNVEFHKASKVLGLPDEAPFDRIIAGASAEEIPDELVYQLKVGGVMVAPVQNSILRIVRDSKEHFSKEEYPGFAFVPLL